MPRGPAAGIVWVRTAPRPAGMRPLGGVRVPCLPSEPMTTTQDPRPLDDRAAQAELRPPVALAALVERFDPEIFPVDGGHARVRLTGPGVGLLGRRAARGRRDAGARRTPSAAPTR